MCPPIYLSVNELALENIEMVFVFVNIEKVTIISLI